MEDQRAPTEYDQDPYALPEPSLTWSEWCSLHPDMVFVPNFKKE